MKIQLFKAIFFCLSIVFLPSLRAQMPTENWKADLAILKTELPVRHPDLFYKWPKAAFEKAIDDLSLQLAGQTDLQIGLRLQAIISQLQDAQTFIELRPFLQRTNPIPFGLGKYSDGIYLSGTVRRFGHLAAKKLIKVNDIAIEEVIRRLGMFVPQENSYCLYKDALNWLRFPDAFKMAGISKGDSLLLLLENTEGKQGLGYVFPLDLKNPSDMQPVKNQQDNSALRWQPAASFFSVNWIAQDSVIHVLYHRCLSQEIALEDGDEASAEQFPPFQPLSDSIIALVEKYPGAKLLIDLRFNPGGASSDGARLAERLAHIPSVNQKHKLLVAVNLYTNQAAIDVASEFRLKTNALIIGEPTAGKPNHFVKTRMFTLPNSKLQVFHPTVKVSYVSSDPMTLMPDQIIPLNYADYRKGADPVYEWVVQQKNKGN
jgi:hypothetical protein